MTRLVGLIVVLLAWAVPASAAITFFGVASTPADNGTNTADPTAVTPPASMLAGDLAIASCGNMQSNNTFAISETGGQAWVDLGAATGTTSLNLLWTRFDGAWDADPSFDASGVGETTCVLIVFRPTAGANMWAVDNTIAYVAKTAATTYTTTGVTRGGASSVALSVMYSEGTGPSTWGSLSGAGWSKTGLTAQYRTTSGADSSMTLAYSIGTGATNDVAQTQSSSLAGVTAIVSFAETTGATGPPLGTLGMLGAGR